MTKDQQEQLSKAFASADKVMEGGLVGVFGEAVEVFRIKLFKVLPFRILC